MSPTKSVDPQNLMNPTRIPVEVLENVFGYVNDKNTLYNLAITCRFFNVIITPRLYEQVPMVDDDPRKIRDESLCQTINERLTKLLEYLTPEKAQHVKLLALDPTTVNRELDIFSHFTSIETLVLYFPFNFPTNRVIKLHPQLLKVTNLAFRLISPEQEYSNIIPGSYSHEIYSWYADDYLRLLFGYLDNYCGPYPSDLHLIFDTSLATSDSEEFFSGRLIELGVYGSVSRVHTNRSPSVVREEDEYEYEYEDNDELDESLNIRTQLHYYPSSYWNLGRATTNLWDPPEFRNEGYKLKFFGAINSKDDLEQKWGDEAPLPLPPDHLLPKGWKGEGHFHYFHGTHIILSDVFNMNMREYYWPTSVVDAIQIIPPIDGQTFLLELQTPSFRPRVLDAELDKMYLEIQELVGWSENEGQPGVDDQIIISEAKMAILTKVFLSHARELYVNTCPEVYSIPEADEDAGEDYYVPPSDDGYISQPVCTYSF